MFTKQGAAFLYAYGIGVEEHDHEGRVITLEFPEFYHVTVYTPNSQQENARLAYRMEWEDAFRAYVSGLWMRKSLLIICGDLNVAHNEIDLKNPANQTAEVPALRTRNAANSQSYLGAGFVDTFRYFYPDAGRDLFLVELSLPVPERRTQGGGLIIMWFPHACRTS